VVTKEHTRDNLGCPQLSWDRWDNLDLGLGGAIHHARDNPGCPWLSWDRWDIFGLGLGGVHGAYQGQPRMSWMSGVVAGTTLAFDGNPR